MEKIRPRDKITIGNDLEAVVYSLIGDNDNEISVIYKNQKGGYLKSTATKNGNKWELIGVDATYIKETDMTYNEFTVLLE